MTSARRWLARAVLLGVVAAGLYGAFGAIATARSTFRYARRHRAETLERSQDRLFGRDYMESIRAVRRRFGATDRVYFIDEASAHDGSNYFALYHLAPRRLERFGTSAELAERRFHYWLPRRVRTVLVVPRAGAPLQLIPAAGLRPQSARAREARP